MPTLNRLEFGASEKIGPLHVLILIIWILYIILAKSSLLLASFRGTGSSFSFIRNRNIAKTVKMKFAENLKSVT